MEDAEREAQYAAWEQFLAWAKDKDLDTTYAAFRDLCRVGNRYATKWEAEIAAARKTGVRSSSFWSTPHFMSDVRSVGGPDAKPYGGLHKSHNI